MLVTVIGGDITEQPDCVVHSKSIYSSTAFSATFVQPVAKMKKQTKKNILITIEISYLQFIIINEPERQAHLISGAAWPTELSEAIGSAI